MKAKFAKIQTRRLVVAVVLVLLVTTTLVGFAGHINS